MSKGVEKSDGHVVIRMPDGIDAKTVERLRHAIFTGNIPYATVRDLLNVASAAAFMLMPELVEAITNHLVRAPMNVLSHTAHRHTGML